MRNNRFVYVFVNLNCGRFIVLTFTVLTMACIILTISTRFCIIFIVVIVVVVYIITVTMSKVKCIRHVMTKLRIITCTVSCDFINVTKYNIIVVFIITVYSVTHYLCVLNVHLRRNRCTVASHNPRCIDEWLICKCTIRR